MAKEDLDSTTAGRSSTMVDNATIKYASIAVTHKGRTVFSDVPDESECCICRQCLAVIAVKDKAVHVCVLTEQPGAITVSVIEACPFAHEVIEGVHVVGQHSKRAYVRCYDCYTDGPSIYRIGDAKVEDKTAIEKWNARRKV